MTVERHLILQEKVLSPSAEWQPRSEGWLILRVAEGSSYWLQNGLPTQSIAPGDILILSPLSEGLLRASQLGSVRLHYFTVLPASLSGVLTLAEGFQFEMAGKNIAQHLPASPTDSIHQKFALLATEADSNLLATRCACLQLWSEAVAGLLLEKSAPIAGDEKLRERFRQLVGEIPENELASHSLAELAGRLHCSERHFSRLFREQFGASLRTRQIELRLQRARHLLTNSNAKIINVALESGYRHLGLFNAMFKKRFGVTPSEWRRQNVPRPASAALRGGLVRFATGPTIALSPRKY